jgi:hypothetical protein
MSGRTARILCGGGIVLGALVGPLVAGSVAGARSAGRAIGPDQSFVGQVNGETSGASIIVDCPEGLQPAETGPPASGQTIGVRSPSSSTAATGETGTRGRTIVAEFVGSDAAAVSSTVSFSDYGVEALPTRLKLPCLGSGTVVFSPRPTSGSARSETMTVTFITPCNGICADRRH